MWQAEVSQTTAASTARSQKGRAKSSAIAAAAPADEVSSSSANLDYDDGDDDDDYDESDPRRHAKEERYFFQRWSLLSIPYFHIERQSIFES